MDPDPDPESSFVERKRLFELPGSSWADYDKEILSEGGAIFDRRAKQVTPSAAVRAALGMPNDAPADMTPAELIRWILRAPVDLLWNGGIGTYVKATRESNADVGDRANDPVRVNGKEVRARVVGEGGNLGFTQRGRIEYARGGGRINTDFIDNSAGVDTSDHEVNWKILLGLAVARGELTTDERNAALQACTDDVVEHVLYDNYLQAQILSQELVVSAERIESYEELMQQLEADGELDREVEFLPGTDEMMERRSSSAGMTRPELSVLLAYAKRAIAASLLKGELPDSPHLEHDLIAYFPPAIVERFGHLIPDHPLRRELLATIAANEVVNDQGITFVSRLVSETGLSASDVVWAFRVAREVTGAKERWDAVEALDGKVDPSVQNELMGGVDWLVEATTRWYLVQAPGMKLSDAIDESRASFAELSSVMDRVGSEGWREEHLHEARRLAAEGVPDEVAVRHAFQPELVHGPDIIAVAHATDRPVLDVARAFFLLGERLEIDWVENQLDALPVTSRWQRWARQSTEDDLFALRRSLVERLLQEAGSLSMEDAVAAFLERRAETMARLERFIKTLAVDGVTDLSQLTVALRQLRLVERLSSLWAGPQP